MLFFVHHGYRVIAHDRRGHGRSAQPSEGNDMDHYADDLAVTPSVLQTDANPAGTPQAGFEGLQAALAANRSEFYRAVPSGPFYIFDQPGVQPSEAIIANWWRQGMMGSAKGQYDCVSEFIRQDWSDDLKKITVPVLAMNGDADQIVPHDSSGPRAVELVQNGTLKSYPGFPHGMPTTHADTINKDLLDFIQS
jgi:non-heme chloroperoxidase